MSTADTQEEAREIGLRFSSDNSPGYMRTAYRKGFRYLDPAGQVVRDPTTLNRIAELKIPPAWSAVWICPSPRGYLQATGKDAKGRKQAIYHPEWIAHRDASKFHKLAEFGRILPKLRQHVERDLSRHGLPKEKVVAVVVHLLETSLIRVGNKQYAVGNHSFGLTTLENRHAQINSTSIVFAFKGKSGKYHKIKLHDRRLASVVRKCQELPGQALLEYLNEESTPAQVTSTDVNQYIRTASGGDFTAKSFRTWAATVEAVRLLKAKGTATDADLKAVVQEVARRLGNTPAVCRASYIHPFVLSKPDNEVWLQKPGLRTEQDDWGAAERFVLRHVLKER